MGHPDQLLKYLLELEAPAVTHDAAVFVRAPEIATSELRPDGLMVTHAPERLRPLPPPWCLLEREAVVDGKMPGDHLDPTAYERCLLRRFARQMQRLEQEADPTPAHCGAWIVAPHWPVWLREWEAAGHIHLTLVGPGCLQIGPWPFGVVWIAANELPLHEVLMPFLVARSGAKLKAFVRWAVGVRPPAWLASVVQSLPEVAAMLPEFKPSLSPEEQRVLVDNLKKALVAYPEAGDDFVAQGRGEGLAPLVRLFERRLRRPLSDGERQTLGARLDTAGAERLGDVVLDLTPEQLSAWLEDPDAR